MKSIEYLLLPIVQGWMQRAEPYLPRERLLLDGGRTTAATFAATLFYGLPLLVGLFVASPAVLPPIVEPEGDEDERVVTFLTLPVAEEETVAQEEPAEEPAPPAPEPVVPAPKGATAEVSEGTADGAPETATTEQGRPVRGDRMVKNGVRTVQRPPGAATARPRKGRNCSEPHPNIRTGKDGVMEIDRSLVDEYTRNLESFMRLGYSRPYDENGVKGWYISGFPCTSPVQKAGFRRGDVLLRVNGKPTRSWVGVFLLYQKLKNKDEFEIELMRKGQPLTLHFRVIG